MNRFFNIWFVVIVLLNLPVALAVGLNQDFHVLGYRIPGEEFEYKHIYFGVSAGLVFLLGALKASKKWVGLHIVRQLQRFQFSTQISVARLKRVLLYNTIEIIFLSLFGALFYSLATDAQYLGLVFFILALEHFVNTLLGVNGKMYRVGMTKKAIIRVDREVTLIYFNGLQKISQHQSTLYFEYTNDLVLHMPLDVIPEAEKAHFYSVLKSHVDPNKVFYSGF